MSNPTIPGHPFVRPGQVAPDRPAPDNCVECGLSEAEHQDQRTTPAQTYAIAAADADARLDGELLGLRQWADDGKITPAEAARLRVEMMENHLHRIEVLREIYFGDPGDGGWISGSCSNP